MAMVMLVVLMTMVMLIMAMVMTMTLFLLISASINTQLAVLYVRRYKENRGTISQPDSTMQRYAGDVTPQC